MPNYILAIDQGTSSSRAILFDEDQHIVAVSQREFAQIYPQTGWVEHDAMEIYAGVCEVVEGVIARSGIDAHDIRAIGIANQRETTVVWNRRTGLPIANAIVWQCRRTADMCDQLKDRGLEDYIRDVTGLKIDAYFSGTKIAWLLDNIPHAREAAENGDLLFGTIDSWLIWKLSGGQAHVTDYTNASRSMLYNIHDLCWDDRLLSELDIPKCMMPRVCSNSEIYATVNLHGADIPIAGSVGDQQGALFGQGCFNVGDAKNTYGTGCFLLMNTGDRAIASDNGLLTTIAIGLNGHVQYALEGSVFIGGAVVQWLRDEIGLIRDAKQMGEISASVPDCGGVYLVPAFAGLGAPCWDMRARGTIVGLTRGTNAKHIVRAAEESIAYQVMDLVSAMEKDCGCKLNNLRVDGGACRDDFLMQFQADILNARVCRPVIRETTALGAAFLAGLAVGVWKDTSQIGSNWRCDRAFDPQMDENLRSRGIRAWHRAIDRSRDWATEDE